MTRAQAAGVSERSLRRAKAALSVQSKREGKLWVWTLPAVPDVMPPATDAPGEPSPSPPPIAANGETAPALPPGVTLTIENGRHIYRV